MGVGLIGGSLSLAWRERGFEGQVTGFDRSGEALQWATEHGVIDVAAPSLESAVAGAELVVFSTPVTALFELLPKAAPVLSPGTLVTDVCSTKAQVIEVMDRALPVGVEYVGGHPMAGSERAGVQAADPLLFENAFYLLTPGHRTGEVAVSVMRRLAQATGARPLVLSPAEHDLRVATVSHLPQLVAVALMRTAAQLEADSPGTLALAAGGFRDTTRIAASDPSMWADICVTNRDPLVILLQQHRDELEFALSLIKEGDRASLYDYLQETGQERRSLGGHARRLMGDWYELVTLLKDQPGALADLTGQLAGGEVDIRDIEILRVREGDVGTVRLAFATDDERTRAVDLLTASGYRCNLME